MPRSNQNEVELRIDRAIGARIRIRRIQLGLTQQGLADKIDVTYQQIFKYESGINRVSSGRLVVIAAALSTTIEQLVNGGPELMPSSRERLSLNVMRAFNKLTSAHQVAIARFITALAGEEGEQ